MMTVKLSMPGQPAVALAIDKILSVTVRYTAQQVQAEPEQVFVVIDVRGQVYESTNASPAAKELLRKIYDSSL